MKNITFTAVLLITITFSNYVHAESRRVLELFDLGDHILTGKTKAEVFKEPREEYFAARITGEKGSHAMLIFSVHLLTWDFCKTMKGTPQFSDLRHGRDDLSGKKSWTEISFACKGVHSENWSRHVKQLCSSRYPDESAVLCKIMAERFGKEEIYCSGNCPIPINDEHRLYKN